MMEVDPELHRAAGRLTDLIRQQDQGMSVEVTPEIENAALKVRAEWLRVFGKPLS